MKKFKEKQKELKSLSDHWNTLLKRKDFSKNNPEFKEAIEKHTQNIDKDLKKNTELNNFVNNNFRSK